MINGLAKRAEVLTVCKPRNQSKMKFCVLCKKPLVNYYGNTKYCHDCIPSRSEYFRHYRLKHRKIENKPWYAIYRDKYSIKDIPENDYNELKTIVPDYCLAFEKFFGLNGYPMMRLHEIGGYTAFRKIHALLGYLGLETITNKDVLKVLQLLKNKIKKYRKEKQIAYNKKRMANAIGLTTFPEKDKNVHLLDDDDIYFVGLSLITRGDCLTEREADVIRMRYGLDGSGRTKSYSTIGIAIGISRERVRIIINRGLRKIRRRKIRQKDE